MPVIENVTFLYTKIQKPVLKYGSTTDTEWTVDCVVSKADSKKWKKEFPKNKVKEYDNAEFTEKFGIAVPFPDQDEQFVIKVKKDCVKGDWVTPEKYRPRVVEAVKGGENVDITFTKLVSNGSKGKVSYTVREVKDEQFPQLSAILVEELIEYVSSGSAAAGDEFGAKQAPVPVDEAKTFVAKQEDKPVAKPVERKEAPKPVNDDLEESPF
jgi:hypothetical protein